MEGNKVGFASQCHPELDSGSRCLDSQSGEMPNQVWHDTSFGFTLVELLVVVLIIGILSAVAVPQYQKAVLKSRFSSLMPTTKAIADSQEAYYMTNNRYSTQLADLDVTVSSDDKTQITLGSTTGFKYVKATRSDINNKNNLIMYQKHSDNFPGETHCEALKSNQQANWLCQTALKGSKLRGSLTDGYTEYVLEGNGNGATYSVRTAQSAITCSEEENSGNKSCEVTTSSDGSKIKTTCTNKKYSSTCVSNIYDNNGLRTECKTNGKVVDGKCVLKQWGTIYQYDEDGNKVGASTRYCRAGKAEDGTCIINGDGGTDYTYEYDSNGNAIATTYSSCSRFSEDGSCASYIDGFYQTKEYDANGKETFSITRRCGTYNTDGSCETYASSSEQRYEYDVNGHRTLDSFRQCATLNIDGSCATYGKGHDYATEYDNVNGRIISYSGNNCVSSNTDRNCAADVSTKLTYTYDANGSLQAITTLKTNCSAWNTNGSCKAYVAHDVPEFDNPYSAVDYLSNSKYASSYEPSVNDGDSGVSHFAVCTSYTGTVCNNWATYTVSGTYDGEWEYHDATTANCTNDKFDSATMSCSN